MSSGGVWGNVVTNSGNVTSSLSDVMSEELAKTLQDEEDAIAKSLREKEMMKAEEEKYLMQELCATEDCGRGPVDTDKDLELAMMLQAQFDAEVECGERKQQEKVMLNFNYSNSCSGKGSGRIRNGENAFEEDEDEDDSDNEEDLVSNSKPEQIRSAKGYIGRGSNIKTKHDLETAGRRNAERIFDCMDPTFKFGDAEPGEHSFRDPVYNALRRAAQTSDHRRTVRLQEKKDHSTVERAVDERTRRILFQLETQDRLREYGGIVATGKESVVIHARGGAAWNNQGDKFPNECAVKIYKTTLNEFKTRMIYVNGDFRFSKDEFRKQNPRKVIRQWAEKETMNLKRIHKAGIRCPKPIQLTKHVLVMSFIGRNGIPASQLSDIQLSDADWQDAYEQTLVVMKRLYNECNLVHADFSAYNLLWFEEEVWVIDVSQSVEKLHPHALSFLRRDCENVSKFFRSRGVYGVKPWEEHFNELTGLAIEGKGDEFLKNFAIHISASQDYESDVHYLTEGVSRREFAFDYFFDLTTASRKRQEEGESSEEGENSATVDRPTSSTRE